MSKRHMLRWTCDCGRLRAESMIPSGIQWTFFSSLGGPLSCGLFLIITYDRDGSFSIRGSGVEEAVHAALMSSVLES